MRNEFYFFFLVDHLSLGDWLIVNFSFGGFVSFFDDFFRNFRRKNYFGLFNGFFVSSLDVENLLFNVVDGLYESFSKDLSSRNGYRDSIFNFLVINQRIFHYLFSVNRSLNFGFSDNRCLNHSLFDDRLRNNFLIDDRLLDDFFNHFWL